MVDFADSAIGNFTAAVKAKGLWDDMIIVFTADNGGPVYQNGSAGANNCKTVACSAMLRRPKRRSLREITHTHIIRSRNAQQANGAATCV
jgi:arylsulfatase A-like enzyme